MTQTCFSGSYGLILILCGPRPHGCARTACRAAATTAPSCRRGRRRRSRGDSGAPSRASRSARTWRPGRRRCRWRCRATGLSSAYGVHGFGARRQRQLAALRDPDAVGRLGEHGADRSPGPAVVLDAVGSSGSGCGQFSTTSYGRSASPDSSDASPGADHLLLEPVFRPLERRPTGWRARTTRGRP